MTRAAADVALEAIASHPELSWRGSRDLVARVRPIDSVQPYPGNARKHNLEVLRESIRLHGQYRAIIVQRSSGYIIAGNGTWQACREEGFAGVAVDYVDVDDDQARRILLVDNRSNDVAGYDDQALADLLTSLSDLAGTGFREADVADLLASLERGGGGLVDPDFVPAAELEPRTQPGDLWRLGDHRLLCGDATDPAAYARLLGDEAVDLLWTDPPYGVDVAGKNTHLNEQGHGRRNNRPILNDALGPVQLTAMLTAAFRLSRERMRPGAAYYITGPQGGDGFLSFLTAVRDAGLPLRHMIVWVKQSFVFGRSDYHYQHEPILTGPAAEEQLDADALAYGWREGSAHEFHGGRRQSSVWQIPRPAASPLHPTQKPVELVERSIRNSTVRDALVLDPFAGSGTTAIAAQNCGRRARLLELDPVNCDVICRRFQAFAGVRPVLEATGEEVNFVA